MQVKFFKIKNAVSEPRKYGAKHGGSGISSAQAVFAEERKGAVSRQLSTAAETVVDGLFLPELHQRPLAHRGTDFLRRPQPFRR